MTSMKDILGRYCVHSHNLNKLDQPLLNMQMRGEDPGGLNIEELQKLETILQSGLKRDSFSLKEGSHANGREQAT
ncbi:hypothetical protein V6N13_001702 [Hibiscus sabdariffa]